MLEHLIDRNRLERIAQQPHLATPEEIQRLASDLMRYRTHYEDLEVIRPFTEYLGIEVDRGQPLPWKKDGIRVEVDLSQTRTRYGPQTKRLIIWLREGPFGPSINDTLPICLLGPDSFKRVNECQLSPCMEYDARWVRHLQYAHDFWQTLLDFFQSPYCVGFRTAMKTLIYATGYVPGFEKEVWAPKAPDAFLVLKKDYYEDYQRCFAFKERYLIPSALGIHVTSLTGIPWMPNPNGDNTNTDNTKGQQHGKSD